MFVKRIGDIPPITFDKLVFKRHPIAHEVISLNKSIGNLNKVMTEMAKTTQAKVELSDGYCISVVCGAALYSNGVDTYECAVAKDGKVIGDVLPNQSWLDVEKLLAKYQGYHMELLSKDGLEIISYKKKGG